jgi:hypothetical protein
LIGLGGAEFRLPLLIGAFRFVALQAVILNKANKLAAALRGEQRLFFPSWEKGKTASV